VHPDRSMCREVVSRLCGLRSREVTGSVVRRVFQLAGIGWARARRSYSYSSASYSGESLGLCPYWVIVC
jgi:hypothetical protein